ncbi:MAG TPA: hypothetical protein V6C86_07780 [Oculatellaceae cyanobacterium]
MPQLDAVSGSKTDFKLPDGSELHREAGRDVVNRPDGTRIEITPDGPQFFDRNGKRMPMEAQNSKFSGSDMTLPDGTQVSGYYYMSFSGNGTITFPNGDKIEISNERVVVPKSKNWPFSN